MNFIYFVDLNEPLVCINLIRTNKLTSPAIHHMVTYKTIYPLYLLDPDKLLGDLNSTQIGFGSPRFQLVAFSNWAKNGLKIGIGVPNTIFFTQNQIDRIHRIAQLEIDFEKGRREINEIHPSRLSCIYLAEDSIDGRTMLKNMFLSKQNFRIAQVSVCLEAQFLKVDSKWIDYYEKTGDKSAITSYWNGVDYDTFPEHEYLLEGQIELINPEDKIYIENNFDMTKYTS
ncbi:MAG: hypothetical protein ABI426_12015 [Flavobacterium sp.]